MLASELRLWFGAPRVFQEWPGIVGMFSPHRPLQGRRRVAHAKK